MEGKLPNHQFCLHQPLFQGHRAQKLMQRVKPHSFEVCDHAVFTFAPDLELFGPTWLHANFLTVDLSNKDTNAKWHALLKRNQNKLAVTSIATKIPIATRSSIVTEVTV